MLGLLFLAVGGFAATAFLSDSQDEETTELSPDPDDDIGSLTTQDLLDIHNPVHVSGNEGIVQGSALADEMVVDDPRTEHINGFVSHSSDGLGYFDSSFDLVQIETGDGDDSVLIESGTAIVETGAGNDFVDASGMAAGVIHIEDGDVATGSNVVSEGAIQIGVVADGGVFNGGDAAELGLARGTGVQMSGGGGDDTLHAYSGDAILDGGDGNDTLLGNADEFRFSESSRVSNISTMSNSSSDTLIGGSGDDRLELSRGDIGTGGTGEDSFLVFANDDSALDVATVTDFSPSEDTLRIQIDGGDPWDYSDSSYDLSGRVECVEVGGASSVLVDGLAVTRIENVTGLSIGYPDPSSLGENPTTYTNIETGLTGAADSFDVLIEVYQSLSS